MGIPNLKVIALIDCDSFYASCEQLRNPSLIGKPVCVMSNNDGCIVARSKEAKALGVKMGMPVFQARKIFPNVCYISGDLGFYGNISARVMSVLREFSPVIEVYSIDEAFIDLTGLRKLYRKSYLDIASDIREEIINRIGVPVSIGVSTTKTLAKLASERAKKQNGTYMIGFRSITNELKNTEPIEIWGIGANTAALLNKYGIKTAYDLTQQNEYWIKKLLGKKGFELQAELTGESIYPVIEKEPLPKSIQKTSSFAKFTSNEQYIKNSLHYHTHRACRKLRRLGLKTQLIGVMLKTKDFKIYFEKQVLVHPSDWEFEIYETVNKLFDSIFSPHIVYRSSGIILGTLTESGNSQLSLFNPVEKQLKYQNLAKIWDKLENKYGYNIMLTGGFKD